VEEEITMKPNQLTGWSPFRTKKKSSELAWGVRATWSAVLGVAIATFSALTAVSVLLLAPQKVKFYNIKAPNLEDLRQTQYPGEKKIDKQTPLFFIGREEVVFGSFAAVVAPLHNEKIVVVKRDKWAQQLSQNDAFVAAKKNLSEEGLVLLAVEENSPEEGDLQLAQEVARIAHQHKIGGKNPSGPQVLWAQVPYAKKERLSQGKGNENELRRGVR
jgi:hypothetical protein